MSVEDAVRDAMTSALADELDATLDTRRVRADRRFAQIARRYCALREQRKAVRAERKADMCTALDKIGHDSAGNEVKLASDAAQWDFTAGDPCWKTEDGRPADPNDLCPACMRNGARRKEERRLQFAISGALCSMMRRARAVPS